MPWNGFEIKNKSILETDSLSSESEQVLEDIVQDSKELQNKIQYFEYKNRSKNWEYFVFSYNTVTWENLDDIKKRYIEQYWWKIGWILITDETWKEISEYEFSQQRKIYLKVKINDNPKPIKFIETYDSNKARQFVCYIKTKWRTPVNIRQIYQDENDIVIEKDRFIISDENGNIYNDSKKFEPWDVVRIWIKKTDLNNNDKAVAGTKKENTNKKQKKSDKNPLTQNKENNDTIKWKSNYKEMIEKQKAPITLWNRNKPEISITFDDGYWFGCIKHILDTLKWAGIKATFFILGDCLRNTPKLWKRAVNEWHQICCHTFSHIYLSDSSNVTNLKSGLNKGVNVHTRKNNVKSLLWTDYYNKIKSELWIWFPDRIKSTILLRTEILMWEAQIKKTLWESYLKDLKKNYPFFRFPGWCGAKRSENIAVLKSLWYLSIWWSHDFYGAGHKHVATDVIRTMNIKNGDIALFHFKQDDYKYIDAYIENMKKWWKSSKVVSKVISK